MISRLLLGCATLASVSCVQTMDEEVRQALMDDALESRVDRFVQQQKEECREEVLAEALWTVDSLFRENPIVIKLDTIERPPVPNKPDRPSMVAPAGDLSLDPLIKPDQEEKSDSLKKN